MKGMTYYVKEDTVLSDAINRVKSSFILGSNTF